MIITCNNCDKKFNIDSNQIPITGRLLQCSNCNYKWFFKKEIIVEPNLIAKINTSAEELTPLKEDITKVEGPQTMELLDNGFKDVPKIEKISTQNNNKTKVIIKEDNVSNIKTPTDKKSYNMLGLIIVFMITFVAIIIVLDTFQKPISIYVPKIEFILYNLYQSINDIILFFKDLI